MSLSQNLSSLTLCDGKSRTHYYIKFQNDVQIIFDEISANKNLAHVNINIVKGSIYLKGDYFIPLKSNEIFQLNCKELLERLKDISCVLSVEVDSNYNLILCLQRNAVYEDALRQVLEYSKDYGMLEKKKTVLVLIDTAKLKSIDSFRNTLLAEHIISILTANKTKVFYSEYTSDTVKEYPNSTSVICCSNCTSLVDICKELEDKVRSSGWKTNTEENGITLDARQYLTDKFLDQKYGKSLNGITISKHKSHDDLCRTAYMKHVLREHMSESPDFIIHIASQGHNRCIYKSGILLGMLEEPSTTQVYIFNQSVQYKNANDPSASDFVLAYKTEIETAMAHKYDTYCAADKTWATRIESLVDTAVKFDFLKVNHNSILNLKPPSSHCGGKNSGIFVQYNYARLSNLFRNFDIKVTEGYYDSLPPLEEIDFSLLKLEEEWNLFYYVLSFPELIQSVMESLLTCENIKPRYRLNKICLMLLELCQHLSLYYSRIRILSGPQAHLQKTMNARLWLLKGIHQVFKNSFVLLNVQGLDQM